MGSASEEPLYRQSYFYQAIENSLADGVYALDQEGRVIFMNAAAEQMLGWTEAELRGKIMHDVIHYRRPDGTPYPREECAGLQVARDGLVYRSDDEAIIRKDGTMFPVSFSSAPILRDGQVDGIIVVFRDITERRRVEEALRASEAKLRLIVGQLPAHVWTTDLNLRITSVLGNAVAVIGLDPQRYVGKTLCELSSSENEQTKAAIAGHLRALQGEPAEYRIEIVGHCFESHVEPLRNAKGQIIGCLGLALNVTARKQHERRQSVLYAVSRVLAEAASIDEATPRLLQIIGEYMGWDYGALWMINWRDKLLHCVNSWHAPTGAFPELDTINRTTTFARGVGLPGWAWDVGAPVWIVDIGTEERFPHLKVAVREGLQGGFALPLLIEGNTIGVIEFFSRAAQELDQQLIELMTTLGGQIGQFIERKRAEEQLRVRAMQQAAIAELGQRALAIPNLLAVMEAAVTLVVRTLDVEYCKILELLPDGKELLLRAGIGWKEGYVGHATVGTGLDSQAGYTLFSSGPVIVENLGTETRFNGPRLLHEHGVVSGLSVIIRSPGGGPPFGVLGTHTTQQRSFTEDDIHFLQAVAHVLTTAIERKRFEEQLAFERNQAERLEELDRLRRDFISTVSHDLQTPLTAIRAGVGFLGISAGQRLAPEEQQLLHDAQRNIESLGMLIGDLLTFNQLQAGVMDLDREAVDLRQVVTEAVSVVHILIQKKGQRLELDLPAPLRVMGDARRLTQVVVNLLANAHRHTPPGTRIVVAGQRTDQEVLLSVSDNGPGILPEEQEAVFERFYQGAATKGGSGLGLAISKGIVALHQGRIWVESVPGAGATFYIALARHADDEV